MIDQNYLEGIRVVLAILLLFMALFAAMNAQQGELVIPRPARSRITWRRRFQMSCAAGIAITLGAQSILATRVHDVGNTSFLIITGNWSVIITLVILIIMVAVHIVGWWREGTIMRVPLDPDAIERIEGAIIRGQHIADSANSVFSTFQLAAESIISDNNISKSKREDLEIALTNMYIINEKIDAWREEIKMLSINIENKEEDDLEK